MKAPYSKHIPYPRSLAVFLLLFLPFHLLADDQVNIDSLRIAYDYSEDPHERVLIQVQIADAYYDKRSIDTAIFEYTKAVGIIHPDSLQLKAKTLDRLSKAYHKKEDMPSAIGSQKLAKELYEKSHSPPENIARAAALIGRAYYAEAHYDSAMVYYMEAKAIYENNNIINDDYGYLLHFIGSVFKRQGDDEKACEYYHEEIEYGRKHQMKNIEVEGMYLSGICYDDNREALTNYMQCLQIYEELESERMVALMYTLISGAYSALDIIDSSYFYQEKCLIAYREMGEISHLAAALSHSASLLTKMGRYREAEEQLKEALEVVKVAGIKTHIRYWDIYESYFELSYARGNYKDAVDYQSLMYTYRDSAMDQQHQDAILEMEKIYDDEKQKAQLAILEKDNALSKQKQKLAEEEAESQSFVKKIFMFGGLLVLGLGLFVLVKYKESVKQKKIISHQKLAMEFQKELVEAKNKDIIDSMVYASSIQKAIITSEDYISKMFSEFFVFYKPRDIVSGDFYWAYETDDRRKLIAVGDCTGHGVPGAMMSMLGTAFLNEIVIEGKIHEPQEVLNKLRAQVKKALNQQERKDGMDMSFCSIQDNMLTYCGANLSLYILRKGELIELKGNKQPVGYQPGEEHPFTQQAVNIEKGDLIYLFSDGYADQFGGPKGKKYKYKTFREKLRDISAMTFVQQRTIIDEEFELWKGDLEQLDDVCVLGIRI